MNQKIIVSTLNDENDGDFSLGDLSFREAIAMANEQEGADTITFEDSLNGSITLTNGELIVEDALAIEGLGVERLTIDGNSQSRVLKIDDGNAETNIDVTIDGLTISGGDVPLARTDTSGGGILTRENLELNNSKISGNAAVISGGGIYSSGERLVINNSTIEDNSAFIRAVGISTSEGGGIATVGTTVEINDSVIANNASSLGGGAINAIDSQFNINNSSITDNFGLDAGGISAVNSTINLETVRVTNNVTGVFEGSGAIRVDSDSVLNLNNSVISDNFGENPENPLPPGSQAFAAGIGNAGVTNISNSTITGNTGIGFGVRNSGDLNVTNSTFSGNDNAGINNEDGAIAISNSTIADNITGFSPDEDNSTATIVSSIIVDNSEEVTIDGNNNLTGNSSDLLLGELQDNGGSTETIALQEDSPAIDAGSNPNNLETDQRGEGFDRTVGNGTDIGAFEVQDAGGEIPTDLVVSTLEDENDGDFSPGDLSLREAIALSNEQEGADTITFDSSLNGGTITLIKDQSTGRPVLANAPLIITDSVTIDGLGADNITIDGDNGGNGIFEIGDGESEIEVIVEDVTLANGAQTAFFFPGLSDPGGTFLVNSNAELTLQDSVITGSSASIGGAISNYGTVNIIGSTIQDSTSGSDGPSRSLGRRGVINNDGEMYILDSKISDNNDGGISNLGTLEVDNSNISNNSISIGSRDYAGGGIDNLGTATITNSNITGNSAPIGSGINNREGGTLTVDSSTINQNRSSSSDNSVIFTQGTTNIINSSVSDNDGGGNVGIVVESGTTIIEGSTIANNRADQAQTGIIIRSDATVDIINSTIANNQARSIGGVSNDGTVNITNSTIFNNSGGLLAGGINNSEGGKVTLTSSLLAGNGGSANIGDISGDGEFISGGNNLISNGDDASGFADGVNGDIIGSNGDDPLNPQNDLLIDPRLGELQNNGGSIETIALLEDSPAIDAGSNPNNLETDQRGEGFERTVGNGTDIGAFELQSEVNGGGENFVVSTLDDENDGNFSQGDLSLREAISLASVTEGEDTISFDSSLEGGIIVFDESLNRELTISGGVIIDGLGQDNLTLDGGFIFKLAESDADLNIDGLNIVGGAIDSFGDLTLTNSTIAQSRGTLGSNSDNSSIISRQTLNISNSSIVDSSGGDNLGILIESGTANIENSTIANHEGVLGGSGVLILSDETVNISNSTIANNQNRFVGGVANAGGGEVNISNSTIANNNGGLGNGGIQNSSGTVTVTSTILAGNAGAGTGDVAGNGEFISGGNNLISNGDDATGFINGVNGDLVGSNGDDPNNPQSDLLIDARLGELQNNGGATETIALLDNSPAIDAGSNPNNLTTDQRGEGFDRTVGQGTDVGAFEVQLTSTPNPDTLEGTDGDDTLVGGAGDDRIAGNGGNDAVFGGDGNDHIFGGLGRDTLVGGKGNDTLRGEEGNDILLGGEGHESLRGGDGDDLINGEGGNDILHGDAGNDTLIGGGGRDTLEGGHGHDTFVLNALGEDTITDFADGSDRLQLSGELKFDDLHIVNRESDSGVNIFQNNGDRSIVAVIENVHAADLDLHDFT